MLNQRRQLKVVLWYDNSGDLHQSRRRHRFVRMTYVFDFDGVLFDTARECFEVASPRPSVRAPPLIRATMIRSWNPFPRAPTLHQTTIGRVQDAPQVPRRGARLPSKANPYLTLAAT